MATSAKETEKRIFGEKTPGATLSNIGRGPGYESYQWVPAKPNISMEGGNVGGRASAQSSFVSEVVPQKRTTTWAPPAGPAPTPSDAVKAKIPNAPDIPEYNLPTYQAPEKLDLPDIGGEKYSGLRDELTQTYAAPGLMAVRRGLREANLALGREENINVRRSLSRSVLAGAGESIQNVMSGASSQAAEETRYRHGMDVREAEMNYQTAIDTAKMVYAGELHAEDTEFQAALEMINRVWGAEAANELQYVADVNSQNRAAFNQNMQIYLNQGTTTTVAGSAPSVDKYSAAKTTTGIDPRVRTELLRLGISNPDIIGIENLKLPGYI